MATKHIKTKIGLTLLSLLLSACSILLPQSDVEDIQFPTNTPEPTTTPTEPVIVTETLEDTPTLPPTETLVPTPTVPPTSTPETVPCDWAYFIQDVTVRDGTDFLPNEAFVKTWRIRNIGLCTWTTDYTLVFAGGTRMDSAQEVSLPSYVRPGEAVDISISLKAPSEEGTFRGYWLLQNELGQLFGMGDAASNSFWTEIDVVQPCNWAQFVKDVTVPDNTVFAPGTTFVKTWRLKNIGSCTWTKDYDLVFDSGHGMNGPSKVALKNSVAPGETVDLSVTLISPNAAGDYRGYWMLRNANGAKFGLGSAQATAFWADIEVINPDNDLAFDFAFYYCLATWKTNEGTINCPSSTSDEDGSVSYLSNPDLENRPENEPAIWVRPNESNTGWISGEYPEIEISDGDHFRTWVGCLEGNEDCDITFQLDYQIDDGPVKNLGRWREKYDGEVTKIDIDLSFLAGEDVHFILSMEVENNHPEDANGFWFVPRIENVEEGVSLNDTPENVIRTEG